MALNYDALTALTREYFIKSLADNVFDELPTLNYFREKGDAVPGGRKIVQPLIYAQNTARGSFKGYDVLDTSPTDEFTAAEYPWARLYVNISISGEEEDQNRGKLAVVNLLRSKMEVAKQSIKDMFADQLFGDGTGNGGKDLLGLQAAVDDGTNVAVYGGIDRTQHGFWKSQYRDLAGANITLSDIGKMITACSDGSDRPDRIVCDPEMWDHLLDLIEQKVRYVDQGKTVQVSYDRIMYRGIEIVWDRKCPAGTLYFLNRKYLKLRPHVDYKNFKDTGWKKPTNQDAAVMQILWYGQLMSSNCRRTGKIVNAAPGTGA